MYTALYRKKRPKNFNSVIGQKAIVATLKNQLHMQRISHAYLFSGTRGTGKTSTAKIFARALNCPQSQTLGEPCNECEICTDILAERSLNVIEIDAASNNGVDNIRELREEVKYPPATGTHKVYIIDEAHMLTVAAFNALLKTLEEPPQHVIFILATTDPQKVPATILSRCQRYDFKRISKADMVETLLDYMAADNVTIEKPALEYIASVSDGAMRDALSILDQCLSLYITAENSVITLTQAQNLLGAVDQNTLFEYTNALFSKNTQKALEIIANAFNEGRDLARLIADIIQHLRNVLVATQITNNDILDCSQETLQLYKNQAQNPMQLIAYIREFSEFQ
ncbi:MAG: DNA polymerase III subunit gamma/tau, partial [Defluviitaleaceae bacterium]|nr:DNA polymerase III subunit gamma/tau [Defluviitaleaceae bacterium]